MALKLFLIFSLLLCTDGFLEVGKALNPKRWTENIQKVTKRAIGSIENMAKRVTENVAKDVGSVSRHVTADIKKMGTIVDKVNDNVVTRVVVRTKTVAKHVVNNMKKIPKTVTEHVAKNVGRIGKTVTKHVLVNVEKVEKVTVRVASDVKKILVRVAKYVQGNAKDIYSNTQVIGVIVERKWKKTIQHISRRLAEFCDVHRYGFSYTDTIKADIDSWVHAMKDFVSKVDVCPKMMVSNWLQQTAVDDILDKIDPNKILYEVDPIRALCKLINKLKENRVSTIVGPKMYGCLKPMLPCLSVSDLVDMDEAWRESPASFLEMVLTKDMYEKLTSEDQCLTKRQRTILSVLLEHKDSVLQLGPCLNKNILLESIVTMGKDWVSVTDAMLSDSVYDMLSPCIGEDNLELYTQLLSNRDSIIHIVSCVHDNLIADLTAAIPKGFVGVVNFLLSDTTYGIVAPCMDEKYHKMYKSLYEIKVLVIQFAPCCKWSLIQKLLLTKPKEPFDFITFFASKGDILVPCMRI